MAIEISELSAGYGNRTVIKDVSLKIKKGRISSLLGRNGSGKTTLLRCINGFIKPKLGRIKVEGEDIEHCHKQELAKLISLVPQKTHSAFSFSVLDMVLMGEASRISYWGSPKKDAYEKAEQLCNDMGIGHLVSRCFNDLSGGEQQLVLITRAIMQNAPVMLLDEPISHLDFCNQHKVMSMIKHIVRSRNVTALVTLHDPNIACYYSDDVVMIKDGGILNYGDVKDTFVDANLCELYGELARMDCTTRGLKVVVPHT